MDAGFTATTIERLVQQTGRAARYLVVRDVRVIACSGNPVFDLRKVGLDATSAGALSDTIPATVTACQAPAPLPPARVLSLAALGALRGVGWRPRRVRLPPIADDGPEVSPSLSGSRPAAS